jgi:LPS-assembly lipoprotein
MRGQVRVPPAMKVTYIEGSSASNLVRYLRQSLRASGVNVVDAPTKDSATLDIIGERQARNVLAISRNAQIQEYSLAYIVNFSVAGPNGKKILPAEQLVVRRSYRYDAKTALGTSSEETILRQEMERDMAELILRRVEFAK